MGQMSRATGRFDKGRVGSIWMLDCRRDFHTSALVLSAALWPTIHSKNPDNRR